MTTIELTDNNLSSSDFFGFTGALLKAGGSFVAYVNVSKTANDEVFHRLTQCEVEFDDDKHLEAGLEKVWRQYGFQRK